VNKPVVPTVNAGAVFLSKRRLFLADHSRRVEKLGKGIRRILTKIIRHHHGSLRPKINNSCRADETTYKE
jgi:hypothetical protein